MNWLWRVNEWECFSLHSPNGEWIHGWLNWFQKNYSYRLEVAWSFARVLHWSEESYTWPRGHSLTGGLIVAFANTYIHTLLRLPSTGLFSLNVAYFERTRTPWTSFIHSFRFSMMFFSSAMLKPVSFCSWSTYVNAGLPLFLAPCFGSQSSRSLITSSFFLQQKGFYYNQNK